MGNYTVNIYCLKYSVCQTHSFVMFAGANPFWTFAKK